jgi:hypothetical protein
MRSSLVKLEYHSFSNGVLSHDFLRNLGEVLRGPKLTAFDSIDF